MFEKNHSEKKKRKKEKKRKEKNTRHDASGVNRSSKTNRKMNSNKARSVELAVKHGKNQQNKHRYDRYSDDPVCSHSIFIIISCRLPFTEWVH